MAFMLPIKKRLLYNGNPETYYLMSLENKKFTLFFEMKNLKKAKLLSRLNKINDVDNSEFWFVEEKIKSFNGAYTKGFAVLMDGRKVSTEYCYPIIGG